eukprot:5414907-Pyramimonas_sp.AAC.1
MLASASQSNRRADCELCCPRVLPAETWGSNGSSAQAPCQGLAHGFCLALYTLTNIASYCF